jgi:TrmH family RNA methyltransferase
VTRLGITSVSNARLKTIRKLRRCGVGDAFLVEGYRQLQHALVGGARVRELYVAPALHLGDGEARLVALAERGGAEIVELGAEAFRSVARRARPDGLLALVERLPTSLRALRPPAAPLILVAEGIERPGNLGTIVRTACGAGADAVIACDTPARLLHPDTVQGSVGSIFRVPVAEASTEGAIAWLRGRGIRITVATPAAADSYWDLDARGPLALVVGSERNGVSEAFAESADDTVRIPMGAAVDSLNVAVAAGIVLFEATRQRAATSSGESSSREPAMASASASASAPGG